MKPLSKQKRSISLIGLLIIFIVAVPFLLAYSSGYRLDFQDLTFEKTGGVFIHSDLSETKVFINEEYVEGGGRFLKNVLVQNLKSNETYSIRVEKDGYLPWYKKLVVSPNLVTEARILMMPIEIPFEKVEQFEWVPNKNPSVKATSTKKTTAEYEDDLEIFTSTSTVSANAIVFEKELVKATTTNTKATSTLQTIVPEYLKKLSVKDIENKKQIKEHNKMIAWLEAGNINIMWSGDKESTPFFMCDTENCKEKIVVSLDTDISYFDFYPNRNDAFIVATQNHIFAVEADDRSKQNIQTIFKGKKPEFRLQGNTILVKDGQDIYKAEI